MKEYVLSIICASVISAVVCTVAPQKNGINRYVAFAASLLVTLCLLSPLISGQSLENYTIELSEEKNSADSAEFTVKAAAQALSAYSEKDIKLIKGRAYYENGSLLKIEFIADFNVVNSKDFCEKLSEALGVEVTITDS